MFTCLYTAILFFIDIESLSKISFSFLYLKCNVLIKLLVLCQAVGCCTFYLCLYPINLVFFFRSSVQDYYKLLLSSVVLSKECNIG